MASVRCRLAPERATPALRERLVAIEQTPLLDWIAETQTQFAALKEGGPARSRRESEWGLRGIRKVRGLL